MTEINYLPSTEEEVLQLGLGPHQFTTSLARVIEALEHSPLRLEYLHESAIIRINYANLNHEIISANVAVKLATSFGTGYLLVGSNHRIYNSLNNAVLAPDLFVIKGKVRQTKLSDKIKLVTNPWLIVEVHSPSTEAYDLGTKLSAYKKFPTVEYILYVHQNEQRATLHSRSSATLWRSEGFGPEQPDITIGDAKLSLTDIYQNLPSEEE